MDDALNGSFDSYLIFDNIEVAYPRGVFVPQAPLAFMQSKDSVATREKNNSYNQGKQKLVDRPFSSTMPHASKNDMNFSNISVNFPYYVSMGLFSAANGAGFAIKNLFYAMPTENATRLAVHPLTDVVYNTRTRYDVHVKLCCVMNSFQTGTFVVNYGNFTGEPLGKQLVSSPTGSMMTINWNITEQDSIEFDLPYVNRFKFFAGAEVDPRFFTIANTNIIPTMAGVGDTVFVYALITLTKFMCFDTPRNNYLVNPGKRPASVLSPVAYMQSDDGDDFSSVMMATSRVQQVSSDGVAKIWNNFWPYFYGAFMNTSGYLTIIPMMENGENRTVDLTLSSYEVYPEYSLFDTYAGQDFRSWNDGTYDFSNMQFSYCNGYRLYTISVEKDEEEKK
jgi:hypothetical protein